MIVKPVDHFIHQVKDGHKDRVVNLSDKTYTCRRFDLDLLPLVHVCAAIKYVYCHNGFLLDLDDHKNKWSRH